MLVSFTTGIVVQQAQAGIALVQLEDPWAERRLMVIVQRLDTLPSHARRLAEHLAAA
jgi:hypothetical protein